MVDTASSNLADLKVIEGSNPLSGTTVVKTTNKGRPAMGDTLVLDVACIPLGRVRWRRALALLRKNKAVVIEEYEDWTVHSATVEIKVPSIIKLIAKFLGGRKGVKFSRQNIYIRDRGTCQYCMKKVPMPKMTLDHVIPRAKGGKTTWENTVIACQSCNIKKACRTPEEAYMYLTKVPNKPKSLGDSIRFTIMFKPGMPESWREWLRSYSYWNEELEG